MTHRAQSFPRFGRFSPFPKPAAELDFRSVEVGVMGHLRSTLILAVAACGFAWSAHASTKPSFGAPPAWVDVAPLPDSASATDTPALKTILDDNQSRLGPTGDVFYSRRVIKVLKPEGLSDLTSQTFTWSPDTESLAIHSILLRRGATTIDLMQGGSKVLVLRRETGLEAGMLDGRLTATRQLDGLQVGDILDVSWTISKRDPATKGWSEDPEGLSSPGITGRYRVRITWPSSDAVHWRTSEGLPEPKVESRDGWTTLLLDAANLKPPTPPPGAPPRFSWGGRFYASSYGRWEDVSRTVSPLFEHAEALKPASPIKAEAAAIAAGSRDPKVRAFAALKLVQDKVRYFYIGTNDGGYVPAEADETWARRFGDCKGKTVLLLALLKELGVEAAPALVSTTSGDGLDEEPAGLFRFDHVIVRAAIAGKVYWLDGTRQGDAGGLDAQQPPPWRWALPLRAQGAGLERIVQPPLDKPQTEILVRLDASKGIDAPAPAEIHVRMLGDGAVTFRGMAARMSKEDLEKIARRSFSSSMSWIEPKSVSWRDDPQANVFQLDLTGVADMNWRDNTDLHVREFHLSGTSTQARIFPRREPGPGQDAPFAIAYPYYMAGSVEVTLPDKGAGFSVRGGNFSETVGEYEVKRSVQMDGGVARFVSSIRSLAPEIAATSADTANKAFRRFADQEDLIRTPIATPQPPGAISKGQGTGAATN